MKIGFIINPIAGLGGKVALKGTDNNLKQAISLGAKPVSPKRANLYLKHLQNLPFDILEKLILYSPPGTMGLSLIRKFTLKSELIPIELSENETTSKDTIKAIQEFEKIGVDIITFVGGDGTSVDIFNALQKSTPILGIPSGVKTYGAVFAHSPEEAVSIIESFFRNRVKIDAEVMDLDEAKYRSGILSAKLFGYTKIPGFPQFFQQSKERIEYTEEEELTQKRLTEEIIDQLKSFPDDTLLIIGPGSTFTKLAKFLNVKLSLLGVDCVKKIKNDEYKLIINDAREDQILSVLEKFSCIKVLITPIGGLGYLLGRGNHQISEKVIEKINKDDIIVAASNRKLNTIKDRVLRVDVYNDESNTKLQGYIKVITDRGEMRMMKVVH